MKKHTKKRGTRGFHTGQNLQKNNILDTWRAKKQRKPSKNNVFTQIPKKPSKKQKKKKTIKTILQQSSAPPRPTPKSYGILC